MPRALVIGDVMTDIAVRLEGPIAIGSDRRARILERPGGAAASQAIGLARCGIAVDFVGRVGAADHGRQCDYLAREGVTPHLVADPDLDTGKLVAIVDPSGERSFLTDRGANDALTADDIPDALIAQADLIHLSGYTFLSPAPRAAALSAMRRANGRPFSVDPGSAEPLREMGAELFLSWIASAAIIIPNAEEAAVLTGTAAPDAQIEALADRFPLVVVKRGAAGCEARRGAERWRVAAPWTSVVDTTGAGDAFAAAFLAAWLLGESVEASLRRAVAAGSAATEYFGGRPAEAGDRE
jgi:sugar/nucleoside kinase (ribokinase family)